MVGTQRTRMATFSGQEVCYADPSATKVLDVDLFIALRRMPRYACARRWSVLQHLGLCVLLARQAGLPPESVQAIAMHDAAEAYLLDIPKGLKELLGEVYSDLEWRWSAHVHDELGVPRPALQPSYVLEDVHRIDKRALVAEVAHLVHPLSDFIGQRDGAATAEELLLAARVSQMLDRDLWVLVREAMGGRPPQHLEARFASDVDPQPTLSDLRPSAPFLDLLDQQRFELLRAGVTPTGVMFGPEAANGLRRELYESNFYQPGLDLVPRRTTVDGGVEVTTILGLEILEAPVWLGGIRVVPDVMRWRGFPVYAEHVVRRRLVDLGCDSEDAERYARSFLGWLLGAY